jgi:hypothetical protein
MFLYCVRICLSKTLFHSLHRSHKHGTDFVLQKFHCFLFDTCFVVTRICRPSVKFTICAPVIPAEQITVEEVELRRRSAGSETARTGKAPIHQWFSLVFIGTVNSNR